MRDSIERLKEWAEPRGLDVRTTTADQREPDNIVAIVGRDRAPGADTLVRKSSRDGVEIAAFYVIETLERLGVEVPPAPASTPGDRHG
jgi:hypothetical protein